MEIDDQLKNSEAEIVQKLKKDNSINFPPFVEIKKLNSGHSDQTEITDTSIYMYYEDEEQPFRQLISYKKINGNSYKIIIRISLIEKDELFISLLIILAGITAIFSFLLLIVNRKSTKEIFSSFYANLSKLKEFKVSDNSSIQFEQSEIDEFKDLNQSLTELTDSAKNDYNSLKQFTEEMNHEIQTPLAVVKSKLELLLQFENDKNKLETLNSAQKHTLKLEKVSKLILLLNKLDHKDLFESEEENISEEIRSILNIYEESIYSKNIKLNLSINNPLVVKINHGLLNILLNNLISNSVRHNVRDGFISIGLKSGELLIENSTEKNNAKSSDYFKRFFKKSVSDNSIGLGLTIVEKICSLYKIDMIHDHRDKVFTIKLMFNNIINN
jgi:signal transduction histidine kinase